MKENKEIGSSILDTVKNQILALSRSGTFSEIRNFYTTKELELKLRKIPEVHDCINHLCLADKYKEKPQELYFVQIKRCDIRTVNVWIKDLAGKTILNEKLIVLANFSQDDSLDVKLVRYKMPVGQFATYFLI